MHAFAKFGLKQNIDELSVRRRTLQLLPFPAVDLGFRGVCPFVVSTATSTLLLHQKGPLPSTLEGIPTKILRD